MTGAASTVVVVVQSGSADAAWQLPLTDRTLLPRSVLPAGKVALRVTLKVRVTLSPAPTDTPAQVIVALPESKVQAGVQVAVLKGPLLATRAAERTSVTSPVQPALPLLAATTWKWRVAPGAALLAWPKGPR